MQTTGGCGVSSRGAWSPREIVIMPPWFYKDIRAWPVFSHLSAPGSPICYCETSQSRAISFGKDRTSFTGNRIAEITSDSFFFTFSSFRTTVHIVNLYIYFFFWQTKNKLDVKLIEKYEYFLMWISLQVPCASDTGFVEFPTLFENLLSGGKCVCTRLFDHRVYYDLHCSAEKRSWSTRNVDAECIIYKTQRRRVSASWISVAPIAQSWSTFRFSSYCISGFRLFFAVRMDWFEE